MKKQITFLTIFIVLGFCSLQAQVTQEWVQRYNAPINDQDYANSLAVDSSGNVYITGNSSGDYATIKYNSSGVQQWIQRYTDGLAWSIAVDGSGNVYVTGRGRNGTDYNYTTIKYNSSGVQQWIQKYKGNGGESLVVDSSGNVYVTGESLGDYATIKYNSSGVPQWVQRYNGQENSFDYASSLAVDESGNVSVAGHSWESEGFDIVTIMYNSSGVQQWVQSYNGGENSWDFPTSLSVDGSGNVYVTGGTYDGTGDYATIKYNSSGIQQWVQTYNGPGNGGDVACSLGVDGLGNVYVTGNSIGSGTYNSDYATIKYNSSGVQQWVQRYNGPGNGSDGANSLAVDGSGNVYVTGGSNIGSGTDNSDYATIKYNSSGVQQWVQRYNGPGNGLDSPSSLAVDDSGSVYVTGSSVGSGNYSDYATIKYSQSVGISQTSNSIPRKYSLSQNYPNPFNPKTVIRYSLIENRFTTLKIYDILGNEVTALVNEKQNAGSYEIDFDGSNFSSGVYFYKLMTDNFSETKKMTLIK